jgi:hypothetical protein
MQRIITTVESTVADRVIIGFEYTYDDLSRIVEEKLLANASKICYTYRTHRMLVLAKGVIYETKRGA